MTRRAPRSRWLLLPAALWSLAATEESGDWPSGRHDPRNSAATRLEAAPGVVARAWTFEASARVWGYQPGLTVWTAPALGEVAGLPVVAVGSYDRNLYLLDAATGEVRWRFTTGGELTGAPLISTRAGEAWVFAASSDRVVYALDGRDGKRRWSTAVEPYQPTLGGARLSAPCLGKVGELEALFVGHWVWDKSLANSRQAGGLSALEAATGKLLWRADFLDNEVYAPLYVESGGRSFVLVASKDGNLRALDALSGRVIWTRLETEPIMGGPAVLEDAPAPLVIYGSHFGKVRALLLTNGEEVWSFKAGNWVTGTPALVREGARDLVIFGAYDQRVYALDTRTGEKAWSLALSGPVFSSPAVTPEPDPQVFVAAYDHALHCLSARDGTLLWSVFTGAPIWSALTQGESLWSSPAVGWIGDRWVVYFGSYSGTFYALPVNLAAQGGPSPPWSNGRFWITMAGALGLTALWALRLTRRRRRALLARTPDDNRPDRV